MPPVIRIGDRELGAGRPVFVIAEAGCNHENDFDRAKEMVAAAAQAGADAVKFQTFNPDTLVTRDAPKFWDIPGPGNTQYEEFVDAMPRFTPEQYRELIALADRHGILFFSTPCDEAWVDSLDGLGVALFKIASMDITHLPLLRHVARKGKPIILSTGASYLQEVRAAIEAICKEGNDRIALLHCVSSYPTNPADVNLRMMQGLAAEFPECVIGYSDHTLPETGLCAEARGGASAGAGLCVPLLAVAAGAQVIEKHFTFDRTRAGYDHEISADYAGFKEMVARFRAVERIMGRTEKVPTSSEERARRWGRRSLVAKVPIPQGTRITPEMLAVKRPGTGIDPKFLPQILGKSAASDICEDQVVTWEAIASR